MVTSAVPGSSAVPKLRNQLVAETRDERQVREGLDVLDERRATVDAAFERARRDAVGFASPPLRKCTSALSSPATYRLGTSTIRIGGSVEPRRASFLECTRDVRPLDAV